MTIASVPAPVKKNKLGRVRPTQIVYTRRFLHLFFDDGTSTIVPRMSAHYNLVKDPVPPPYTDWSSKASASLARMYLNDTYGDCVIAGKGHAVGIWSGNESGTPILATDAEIERNYTSICGPGDQGCVITDVLDAMKAGAFVMNGAPAKIANYVAIDWTNKNLVMVGLEVFGAITIGVNLTDDCEDAGPGVVWNFAGSIVGGHDVTLYGCNEQGVLVSTWGKTGTVIPWAVFCKNAGQNAGVEEAYVMLSPDWTSKGNLAPNGIDATTLAADLALVNNGQVPPLPGPTPTPPVPVPPVPVPPVPVPPTPHEPLVVTGTFTKSIWSSTGTFTGTAVPAPQHRQIVVTSWWAVIQDGFAVASDLLNKNYLGLVGDMEKLLTDLGITLPFAVKEALLKAGESKIVWSQVAVDVWALIAAIRTFNVANIEAAALVVLNDLRS